jgi:hypothetical protein
MDQEEAAQQSLQEARALQDLLEYGGFAEAAQNQSVIPAEAEGSNPYSGVPLNEEGTPTGAQGLYYPAEKNMLLGKAVFMTPLECVQNYGQPFCECGTLLDGTEFCYYKRPAVGYYINMEACEFVWGAGYCVCNEPDKCMLYEPRNTANALQCQGQIYFFSGEKMECRKAGVLSAGEDCCLDKSKSTSSCSFENVADTLGIDDLAMTAVSLGLKVADMAGYSLQEYLVGQVSQVLAEEIIKNGALTGVMDSFVSLFGGSLGDTAATELFATAVTESAMNQGFGTAVGQAATAIASAITNFITIAGWIYFAYQVYNMIQTMQECTAGEEILGCKIAKGICHKVGSRCKVKIFDSCLQSMGVYCCFDSKLARIIQEQGRKQIGKSWGSAKKPNCKGFLMDEFVRLDLSRIDFSAYSEDLIREMNPNIQQKLEDAVKNLDRNF